MIDEDERLEVLRRYSILDTAPEASFDRITEIAGRQFDAPISLVTLVDENRVVFKSRCGLDAAEAPRDGAFCAHAILSDETFVVPDASRDARFSNHPLVEGAMRLRFYAGAPLVTPTGHRIGSVCVMDTRPRPDFTSQDAQRLKDLAAIVTDHLEMRRVVGDVRIEVETRRSAEAQARHLGLHDPLTGLANRAYLQQVITEGTPFEIRGCLAAISIDLDQFKSVNDTLGHQGGDQYIRRTADRLRGLVGERGFIARVSGDEFVVLLDRPSVKAIERIGKQLVESISEPISVQGTRISVGVSAGIATADPAEMSLSQTLHNSDIALHHAKHNGRHRCVLFTREMALNAERRRKLEQDLGAALERGEISIAHQPIVRADDRQIVGVEALARWQHPELGAISPVEFVGVAEETGQILALGRHILETAIKQAGDWDDVVLSVNLSPVQFRLPDLADQVRDMLASAGFPANRLQLEVTETVLLDDLEAARNQIHALGLLGVKIALDDFGTGYSSLSYLQNLPFHKVKIDRSFVSGVSADCTNYAIVQCIIGLARELRMCVTAEGIELEEDAELLRAAGCTTLQGYLFGRPMPAHEVAGLCAWRKRAA